ncbi:MAG: peptidylprolyl isomerase [Candidatus Symbiobacter sp.]|nr:peptidylprolyl isomerase [Candidatus Symbiobacter sp.]
MTQGLVTPARAAEDTVVAKAGNVTVTVNELRRRVALIYPEATTAQRNEFLANADKVKELASAMLANKLMMAEARSRKLDDTQDTRDLLAISREDVLVRVLMNDVAPSSSIPAPTEKEMREVYNNNKAGLTIGKQFRVAHIFVISSDERSDDQKKEAKRKIDECYADLKGAKAEQFARSARICSEDTVSRDKGGELGFLVEEQIAPQFKEVLAKMKIGEISPPILTPQGWHILRLQEIKPSGIRPYDDVKDIITQRIKEQKLQVARSTYVDKLMQDNKTEIKDDGIAAVKP